MGKASSAAFLEFHFALCGFDLSESSEWCREKERTDVFHLGILRFKVVDLLILDTEFAFFENDARLRGKSVSI